MARAKQEGAATVPLATKISPDLDAAIRDFAEGSGVTRSEAARVLLAAALDPNGGRSRPPSRAPAVPSNPVAGICPPHPIGRKIGDGCGACGDEKAWRKR